MDQPVTYDSIVSYMNSLEFSGMKLGIDRIKTALKLFGNPEKKLKIIHITGTNGKGSVAAMTSSVLLAAGHKVGMYTSPHLVDVRERIQVNGNIISEDEFREVFIEAKSKLVELTFFELLTLMAVLHFVKKKVDFAVMEVGLGGTYDATNFDTTLISAITKISLDHTDILGKTVVEIARDKSGIIKQGQIVITTSENADIMHTIRKAADEKKAKLVIATPTEYPLALKGQFQKQNAGIVIEIARNLGIKEDSIKKGLLAAKWPGRIEYIGKNILMDSAHNPGGIAALAEYIKTLKYGKLIIVFAVSKNKDYTTMLKLLPEYDTMIFTQSSVARRLPIEEAPPEIECIKIRDPAQALEHAKSIAGEKDLIVVCGSIFLVGDVKKALGPI
jgi:dihydrofolate synthase/folylpolyglutamate synthase